MTGLSPRRFSGLTGLTVSRLKGRPFYGQAMGQLRLTCTFSAECAQSEGCGGGSSAVFSRLPLEGGSDSLPCSTGDTTVHPVTLAPSSGRSWAIALRIGLIVRERRYMSHQAPSGPRPFFERPLSSVAYGDTFFQRKKALALYHAALVTPGVFP